MHTRADAGFVHEVDRYLLEHTCADTPEHMVAGPAFQDDSIDSFIGQELPEQQPRRAGANDGDLGSET
jgi:hypothetical protein